MAKHTRRFTEGMLDDRLIMRALDVHQGQTIVDAGCGNGYMSRLFHREVKPGVVYAVDPNPMFIKEIKADISTEDIRPLVGDMTLGTSLPDGCADVVYMAAVLHIFSDEQLLCVAGEVERLLVPGGLFAVVEIAKHATPFGPPMAHRYSPEELREALPFSSVSLDWVAEHFYLQVFRGDA
ncbi:MAG: class I SAM-dependent methyltransferase [Desulfovibrionaceae bacterium]|nr:class I SAM-dependent methyltransferase [Desulfovibrionaceae bacterium]